MMYVTEVGKFYNWLSHEKHSLFCTRILIVCIFLLVKNNLLDLPGKMKYIIKSLKSRGWTSIMRECDCLYIGLIMYTCGFTTVLGVWSNFLCDPSQTA